MEIVWISALILIFAVLDAIIYKQLKLRTRSRIKILEGQHADLQQKHQDLVATVQALKDQEQQLRMKKHMLEQGLKDKKAKPEAQPQESMEDMLLRKEFATPEQIQKAKRYIKNNHAPMSLLDALIMLDVLDLDTANELRKKQKQGP